MDQFMERLARLPELSPEELDGLETELVAAFDAADESADLDAMQQLADALDQVRAEKANRGAAEEPAPEAAPEAAPAPAMAASGEDGGEEEAPEPTEEAETEEAPAEEPEAEAEAPAEAEEVEAPAEEEPEVEAADESESEQNESEAEASEEEEPVAEITADDVPEDNQPVQASGPVVTIRAGGDIPGVTAGSELSGYDDIVDVMVKKINSYRGVGGDGEHVVVATIRSEEEPPAERVLKAGDLEGNARKIREFLNTKDLLTPEAITAAAPWCAPRMPIYDVPTVGTTARPVRDSLPSFNADRGGITWMQPPGLPAFTGNAVGLWQHNGTVWESYLEPDASDGDPGDEKPCLEIPCGSEMTADVSAITLCLTFDNMMTRAFPEWVRGSTDLTMVAQARFAEQVLLSKMYALVATGNSCATTNPATSIGVARDFFSVVATAAAESRWRLRLSPDAPLQLLVPRWLGVAMAVDLGLQAPGDNAFPTSVSEVTGYFGEHNISPVWHIDEVPGHTPFTGCAFPNQVEWLLYPTGAFTRLDTGELNLGVVRTKEDVVKNKYTEFSETFETVAYMGPAAGAGAWVTKGTTDVLIAGSYSLGTDLVS